MRKERVLALFAHPDDEALLAGGTLAACVARGLEVVLICATRGEAGPISSPQIATRENLGAVRETELRAAAQVLGIQAVECLGYPDGEVTWVDSARVEADLVRCFRQWNPHVVITFGEEGWYWHPDHIAIHDFAMAVMDRLAHKHPCPWVYQATWPKGKARALAAAMAAHALSADLWGLSPAAFGVPAEKVTTRVDVRSQISAKMRALRCHRSQLTRDHLLRNIPEDLAVEFLGYEHFMLARRAPDASGDWLADLLGSPAVRAHGSEV